MCDKKQIKEYLQTKELYHNIRFDNEEYAGTRNPAERTSKIEFNPMNNTILDLGCNIGGCLWEYRYFSPWMIGVEKNPDFVKFCNSLSEYYMVDWKNKFLHCDIDNHIEDLSYLGKFGVIFLFAVTQWIKNWKSVIKWCCDHSELFFIEYNGQPAQLKEFKKYTKSLRSGHHHLGDFNGRFLYVSYNPIVFNLYGERYDTYYLGSGVNCDVYFDPGKDAVVKVYRNKRYENDTRWNDKLNCGVQIKHVDKNRDVVIQEYAGQFLTYYNMPADFDAQIENIKQDFISNDCNGSNIELRIKDGKISVIDFGACADGELCGVLEKEKAKLKTLRAKYLNGLPICTKTTNTDVRIP